MSRDIYRNVSVLIISQIMWRGGEGVHIIVLAYEWRNHEECNKLFTQNFDWIWFDWKTLYKERFADCIGSYWELCSRNIAKLRNASGCGILLRFCNCSDPSCYVTMRDSFNSCRPCRMCPIAYQTVSWGNVVLNLRYVAARFYVRGMELLSKEDSKVICKATGNNVKNSVI